MDILQGKETGVGTVVVLLLFEEDSEGGNADSATPAKAQ